MSSQRALFGAALASALPVAAVVAAILLSGATACGDADDGAEATAGDGGDDGAVDPDEAGDGAIVDGTDPDGQPPGVRDPKAELTAVLTVGAARLTPRSQRAYPRDPVKIPSTATCCWTNAAGQSFDALETVQFVIPATTAAAVAGGGGDVTTTLGLANANPGGYDGFIAYRDDRLLGRFSWGADVPGIVASVARPAHLTVFPSRADGTVDAARAYAVWISVEAPPPTGTFEHHCRITQDIGWPATDEQIARALESQASCTLERPRWRFVDLRPSGGSTYVQYIGTMTRMNDGDILIELADTVSIEIPLTNSFVTLPVQAGAEDACMRSVAALEAGNAAEPGCIVGYANRAARRTTGRVVVRGYGRIDGHRLQARYGVNPPPNPGLAAGTSVALASVSARVEYMVRSGLLELTSSHVANPAAGDYGVDVAGVTVGWAPKRNMGSVVINAAYQPLETGGNDQAAHVFDLKLAGTWVGGSDGPEVMGNGSRLESLYVQSTDDSIKVHGKNLSIRNVTVLQGNAGGVMNLGAYGFNRGTAGSRVENVFVHRITHPNAGYDGHGGVIATRDCAAPSGQNVEDVKVDRLFIPSLGGVNSVYRVFALGFDAKGVFCSGAASAPLAMRNLVFTRFDVQAPPIGASLVYNLPRNAGTTVEQLAFFDTSQGNQAQAWKDTGVKMFAADGVSYAYVCGVATQTAAQRCQTSTTDGTTPTVQVPLAPNLGYDGGPIGKIDFPYQ